MTKHMMKQNKYSTMLEQMVKDMTDPQKRERRRVENLRKKSREAKRIRYGL